MKQQYKKISIQRLETRAQIQTYLPTKQQLIQNMNSQFQWSNYPVLCYLDSGVSAQRTVSQKSMFRQNYFFNAFLYAYTQHGNIVLIPDEIWIMISFYLSTYIDQNAERLRKKIVRHQGTKTLTIVELASSAEQSLLLEKNWDNFFEKIIELVESQTINGVVPALACDFSTTTKTYKTISTAIIMNSFKKYFNYHRMFAGCGINNVYMAGTRQDWAKMISKLQNLIQFDVNGSLKRYISHMKIILQNLLSTYDQKPDVAWWNTIMTTADKRQIYGGQQIQVEGWILNFFGIYQRHKFEGFPEFAIKVPIKITNTILNYEKSVLLVSDFVSVSKLNHDTYKPDVGLSIFTISSTPSKIEKVKKEIKSYAEKKKVAYKFANLNKISIGIPQIYQPNEQKKNEKQRAQTLKKPTILKSIPNKTLF